MRTRLALAICLWMSLLGSAATAGVIRGTLWMTTAASKAAPASATAVARAQRGVSDAVIYIESIPKKVDDKLSHPGFLFFRAKNHVPRMTQIDRRFDPRVPE